VRDRRRARTTALHHRSITAAPNPANEPSTTWCTAAVSVTSNSPACEVAAREPPPWQLPADVGVFVDRQADPIALDARPAGLAACAVTGTAGVGKTALVVHWAHLVADRC
jgi:hypothetical protein